MPTQNPRVLLTLKPHQYELVTRLAKAQRKSRAAVFLELFETVTPMLERVVVAVEAAHQVQSQGMASFKDSVERAEAALLPLVDAAQGQMDMLIAQVAAPSPSTSEPAIERDRAGGARRSMPASKGRVSPRPVTRGPGNPKTGGVERVAASIARAVRAGPVRRRK